MLATLGLFVFHLKTAPFQQLRRSSNWGWSGNERVGMRTAYSFTGPSDETITLSGTLMPEISGGTVSLRVLRHMADKGKAWPLISGNGNFFGLWFIESVEEIQSVFFEDGSARKIEFSLNLKRADDTRIDQLGAIADNGLEFLS